MTGMILLVTLEMRAGENVQTIKLLKIVLDFSGSNSPGIQEPNLIFNAGNILLMFIHNKTV